ncbi:hypothetical protein TUM17559_33730 [Enterobacter cloacae]|nr:hypothetical protein TUM17559_33730 [Enterobacter cloacae]GJL13483.1 hypothetical protein TUM17572_32900 [Klebsiella oxytoca]
MKPLTISPAPGEPKKLKYSKDFIGLIDNNQSKAWLLVPKKGKTKKVIIIAQAISPGKIRKALFFIYEYVFDEFK